VEQDRTWTEPTSVPIGSLADARLNPGGGTDDGVNYASVPV